MASHYTFELNEPVADQCDCCGGTTVRLTRYVYRDDDAFAVYYARYANNHPDGELWMLISLGEWGEGSTPEQRAAFFCRVRPTEDSYDVMLGDGAESPWSHADILGPLLSREEALRHPWRETAFEVLDEAFVQDPSLGGYIQRVHCGDAAVPLERNFGLPDEVFALRDEVKKRARVSRSFVSLDGERFFIRGLLSLRVEDYQDWSVGLWVEIAKADYEHAYEAWDDPRAYAKLRFPGVLANDLTKDPGLPGELGLKVSVFVANENEAPRVAAAEGTDLETLQSMVWPKERFEPWARKRGLL